MWIDTHAHLASLDEASLTAVIERARKARVLSIVNVSTNLVTARGVVAQCTAHDALWGAVGISPFDVLDLDPGWPATLASLCRTPGIIAVGETGLDDSNPRYPSRELQEPVFEAHCALALAHNLPVLVHSRGAEQRVLDILRASGITKAVFHCYTGPRETLCRIIDSGYHVSYSGIITFKNSLLAEVVRATPLDRLFIETDAPWLAPEPHRGAVNEPSLVTLVAEKVAALKGLGRDALREALARNFDRLFATSIAA